MSGLDAIAAQVEVERPALGVDRPRVPDRHGANHADALRAEVDAYDRPRNKSPPQPLADSAKTQATASSARRVIKGSMISIDETLMIPLPAPGCLRNGHAVWESEVSDGPARSSFSRSATWKSRSICAFAISMSALIDDRFSLRIGRGLVVVVQENVVGAGLAEIGGVEPLPRTGCRRAGAFRSASTRARSAVTYEA